MRLIDADALRTRINNVPMHGDTRAFYDIMSELVSVVAASPTIDAELVQSCDECRYKLQSEAWKYYAYPCSECRQRTKDHFARAVLKKEAD